MKKSIVSSLRSFFLLVVLFSSTALAAQLDVDVDINEGDWYENPIYWVVGLLVLILVVLLARRGGGSK